MDWDEFEWDKFEFDKTVIGLNVIYICTFPKLIDLIQIDSVRLIVIQVDSALLCLMIKKKVPKYLCIPLGTQLLIHSFITTEL